MSQDPLTAFDAGGARAPVPVVSPGLRRAGVVVMVVGGCVTLLSLLILLSGGIELMMLFGLFPWLYALGFSPIFPLVLGLVLQLVGSMVYRGSRDALTGAVVVLSIEAVPSALVGVLSGSADFAALALPRVALLIYLGSVLRATGRPSSIAPGDPAPDRPAKAVAPPLAGPRRLLWVVAVAAGLALGVATREVYDLVVLPNATYDTFYDQFDWWFRRAWPAGLLAFAVGWFAESRRMAVSRATVALLLSALVPTSEFASADPFQVVGSAFFGAVMGWLGSVGRGRRWTSVVSALSAPLLLALDALAHRPSDPALSTGRWAVLVSSVLLALVIVGRRLVPGGGAREAGDRDGSAVPVSE